MSDAQDAARLDWLERTGAQLYRRPDRLWNAVSGNRSRLGATPRAAIDAAMRDAAKSERAAENNDAGGDQSAPTPHSGLVSVAPASPPLANAAADTAMGEERDWRQEYDRVLSLLRDQQMSHGLCEPRSRRVCTACNAKDELAKIVAGYKGPRVVLARESKP